MSIARHHAEWLSLVPVSGPFLSLPVLMEAFNTGLEPHDPEHARLLRQEYANWQGTLEKRRADPVPHQNWTKFVLTQTLDLDERVLAEGQAISQTLQVEVPEHHEFLRPSLVVIDPNTKKPRLLVQTYPRSQELTSYVANSPWKASPDTRMTELLHGTGVRLGLVTNGEHWMLVDAPKGETAGYASWYAALWLEEPITLRAFRSLLSANQFFNVPDDQTLEALLAKSASNQQEVTEQLGYQVRRAVEVLIYSLDRADQDFGRELLAGVKEDVLYESALTVMMRLVFLFCAEERELIPSKPFPVYEQNYSVSTISKQLRELADQHGEELLERRYDAWPRLLAAFRAVYGGLRHDDLHIPAYGGNLFNPDRFPFLEGRKAGTTWSVNREPYLREPGSVDREPTRALRSTVHDPRSTPNAPQSTFQNANPLPVNNRTVLHLLEALQLLQVKIPGGGPAEARRVSFRALDIEQIGHVYEGLLDHTAKRATEAFLGLAGTREKEPEIPLAELEKRMEKGEAGLFKFLNEQTGRSESALKKALKAEIDDQLASRFRTACQGDDALRQRVQPFAGLVRLDNFGYPVVIRKGSVFVTAGTDRRSSGTHYTPRSLTEPIVQYTLEPLVYVGPAEGKPKGEWTLKSAKELLDLKICDMACGSGAFLVQAARYMSERLLEAWDAAKQANPDTPSITPEGEPSTGQSDETLIPDDPDERKTYAMRIIAQRCLYGVDKNPLAAEMAKLSLWLLTLAKDKPFEFLDHAIRCGDSLVGLHDLEQLRHYSLKPDADDAVLFKGPLDSAVDEAINLRLKLEDLPANTVEDIERQEKLLKEANEKSARLRCAADLLVAAEFWGENAKDKQERVRHNAVRSGYYVENGPTEEFEQAAAKERRGQSMFHWPLEFPEVIVKRSGFDAFVGNPPFLSGKRISSHFGDEYREYLYKWIAANCTGSADICAHFFLRAFSLINSNGMFGLLATNTISQGDTRKVGLEQIDDAQGEIVWAYSSRPWPGVAAVVVSVVVICKVKWLGVRFLDDIAVPTISPLLDSTSFLGNPHHLKSNEGMSHYGSIVLGMGFILEASAREQLISDEPPSLMVIKPFLNGENLNSNPDQAADRWCIDLGDMSLEEAIASYPITLGHLNLYVKPQRDKCKRKQYRERWWLHAEKQAALYRAIKPLNRAIAIARISRTVAFSFVTPETVFSGNVIVIASANASLFAVMQSAFHVEWSWKHSGTLKSDLMYAPTDCFETFPFPKLPCKYSEKIGEEYHVHRYGIMAQRNEGLTKTYNRFHDLNEKSADIQKLRELHVEMDIAVAAAYGWDDLDLSHGFQETKQGIRFTISESARREVLQRLLKLNHERYAEEVAAGLHDKKASKPAASKKRIAKAEPTGATPQADLFGDLELGVEGGERGETILSTPHPPLPSTSSILDYLQAHPGWHSKDALLKGTGFPENRWNAAIKQLLESGHVEREGEKRGARYRLRKS